MGRDYLVEEVVGLAKRLKPIALIGAGGVGKTSIALTVLHHNRIRERFGKNRRFIRCDEFPASRAHFLARLSKVIGAGVENPSDLTPLRHSLSSKEIFIVLDNAESILDTEGKGVKEIYSVVDELCQLETICLLITSRITTVPPRCRRPEIPTLSMKVACDIFCSIYGNSKRSNVTYDLLRRLGFHALSITLLATTAFHNRWDYDRLAKEWDKQRAQVPQTDHNQGLTATLKLSLASPAFRILGSEARDLLEVVAFFPQGIDENNLDWLFPTISNRKDIFDKLCALSLTYRSNGFITMLAPIRDYLSLQDPQSSPLLCTTGDRYFGRLSVDVGPDMPGFEEARWIASEDVNIEHLLDVFTPTNPNRDDIWDICYYFLEHLRWHKPRETILGLKIEVLPDDHHHKPRCLYQLSQLFQQVGNHAERKRLLTHTLELERRRGGDFQVAHALLDLSDVNRHLCFFEEGIRQAKEALAIFERVDDTKGQTQSLNALAWSLFDDNQVGAAEDAASRAINLIAEKGQEYVLCQLHRLLGKICGTKGEKKKAVRHFETVLKIAAPLDWPDEQFWIHYSLAELFGDEGEFDDASAHIRRAKSHAVDDAYMLGRAMQLQADIWSLQLRLENARSEALHALEIYEKLGASSDAEICRDLLRDVEERAEKTRSASFQGELLEIILHLTPADFHFLA